LLGVMSLTGITQRIRDAVAPYTGHTYHAHTHAHGDYAHTHPHGHGIGAHGHRPDQTPQAWLDRHLGKLSLYHLLRPLLVGVVHGLAGSAAVALLVLNAIRDPWWGVVYLVVFGLGTIAGMMLITAAIAAPFAYSSSKLPRINTFMRFASGVLSLGFGLFLMFYIGFVDGLFTAHPKWTPN